MRESSEGEIQGALDEILRLTHETFLSVTESAYTTTSRLSRGSCANAVWSRVCQMGRMRHERNPVVHIRTLLTRDRTPGFENSAQNPAKRQSPRRPSDCKPSRVFSSLLFSFRYSARSFTRMPGLALALLFTIALGIASAVSVHGFGRGLTNPPSSRGSLDRIVSVFGRDANGESGPLSTQQYRYAESRRDVFQWLGAARVSPGTVTLAGQTALVPVAAAASNLAEAFGLALDDGVVISRRIWQREFASKADIRGAEIQINGVSTRVSGIAPDWLEGIYRDRPIDVWMPMPEQALPGLDDRGRNLWVLAQLNRDISPGAAQSAIQPSQGASGLRIVRYTGMTPEMSAGLSRVGTLLEIAAGAVFFIACVNVGLFLVARAFTRRHETAIRVALGASRGQLIQALLVDSALISVAGGLLGMLLALWTSYLVPALLYEQDAQHLIFAPDPSSIARASVVCVGITILCGLLPVLMSPHKRPIIVLQGDRAGSGPGMRRLRFGLVAAQMASCCVLVIFTAFLLDGLRTALATGAGRRLRHSVFATVRADPGSAIEYYRRVEQALKRVPGISGVAWAGTLPGSEPMRQSFRIEPVHLPLRQVTLDTVRITPDSFDLSSLSLIAGRMFGAAELTCRAAIVNKDAADALFGTYTVGRVLQSFESGLPVQIIGVVAARKAEKSAGKARPTLYYDDTMHQGAPPQRITDVRFRAAVASELAGAEFETNVVSPGYFDAFGGKLIAGQGFSGHTASAECRIGIVNEEAADLYFGGNAVGAALIDENGRRTGIVGVVHSEPLGTFQRRGEPTLYLPMSQDVLARMNLIIHVGEVKGPLLTDLRRRLEAVPGRAPAPVLVRTFETYLNQTSLAPLRIATLILGVSATMALLLSVLGLFGVLNDAARQRRRELAIRLALGAQRWRVMAQVLREGVLLVGAGTLADTPVTRVIEVDERNHARQRLAGLVGVAGGAGCPDGGRHHSEHPTHRFGPTR